MRLKKHCYLAILIVIFAAMTSFAGGQSMREDLKKISDAEEWKYMACDGYTIDLYNLPFTKSEKRLFKVEDRRSASIGNRLLSPDGRKIVFTLETYGASADLYVVHADTSNLVKIPVSSLKKIFLITFLGNDKLLFEDSGVIYILELDANEIEAFSNQEINLNFSSASSDGKLLISTTRGGFVIYNVTSKMSRKMDIDGDRPVLSPDGQWILFRRGGMTGDYHIINVNGSDETLVLSKEKIHNLLKGSGDYRDLHFVSWSPDSRFALFLESSDLQKNRAFVLNIATQEILQVSGN